jgi:hypothetical protein
VTAFACLRFISLDPADGRRADGVVVGGRRVLAAAANLGRAPSSRSLFKHGSAQSGIHIAERRKGAPNANKHYGRCCSGAGSVINAVVSPFAADGASNYVCAFFCRSIGSLMNADGAVTLPNRK